MVEKADIKFGQQLKKGEYENQQTIEKEVEKVMVPPALSEKYFCIRLENDKNRPTDQTNISYGIHIFNTNTLHLVTQCQINLSMRVL